MHLLLYGISGAEQLVSEVFCCVCCNVWLGNGWRLVIMRSAFVICWPYDTCLLSALADWLCVILAVYSVVLVSISVLRFLCNRCGSVLLLIWRWFLTISTTDNAWHDFYYNYHILWLYFASCVHVLVCFCGIVGVILHTFWGLDLTCFGLVMSNWLLFSW